MFLNKLSFFDKVVNRNSLHVDVKGQIGKIKDELQIIVDSFMGVLDDDSNVKYYKTNYEIECVVFAYLVNSKLILKGDSVNLYKFFQELCSVFSQLDARTSFEVNFDTFQITIHRLEEDDIYSSHNNKKISKFIRLRDKNDYLLDCNNDLRKEIKKKLLD